MSKDKFLRGAFILAFAGLMVKIIGSVNRILLSRLLGGEGIGLYQMAYPIYLLALSISSAGIPIAISIIVAEKVALGDFRGANRVFNVSLSLMVGTGTLFAAILYFGAGWLVDMGLLRDARAHYAIIALTPAVFFATILSSYRGYFQGFQMMTPTATSQVIEQFVRVVTMVTFAYWLLPRGLEFAAAGASFGAGPGAFMGLMVLLYFYWKHKPTFAKRMAEQVGGTVESAKTITMRLVRLALPVSLANIMVPVVSSIDMLIVPQRLEVAGYTVEQATALFGYLTGMAMPLVMMATIPTASLAASLVPSISEANTLKQWDVIHKRVATAIRLCSLITIPAFVGMFVLAEPISKMLYGTLEASSSIAHISVSIFFLGLHQVTTGILQGFGSTSIPVINMVVSAIVKIVLVWIWTANPAYGIVGAAWASNIDFAMAAFLNIVCMIKFLRVKITWFATVKIAFAAAIMGAVVFLGYGRIFWLSGSNTISTLGGIILGALIYISLLLLTRSIAREEVEKIPKFGRKIAELLTKIKLIKEDTK